MLLLVLACLATDPKGRFLNDYPVQVGELRLDFAEVRGVATVRAVKVGKLGLPTIYKFATGPGRRKFDFEKIVRMPSGKSSVNCYGYAELDGRNIEVQQNGPSNRYMVRGIGDDDSMRRSYFDTIFGNYLNAPWGFGGFDIADALARGWFNVTEAREVDVGGRSLVEITFRLTTMAEPHYYNAVFDPSLHWAITRASTWTTDPSKPSERYEATYGPTASGELFIKSLHWWGLDGTEKICEFNPVEFTATPASEFTLEHYTLKSPPLPNRKPNPMIVVAIVMMAGALMFAAWFTRRLAWRQT